MSTLAESLAAICDKMDRDSSEMMWQSYLRRPQPTKEQIEVIAEAMAKQPQKIAMLSATPLESRIRK